MQRLLPMLLKLIKTQWPIAAGALIGGTVGYYGQCQSGTCIFTATWWGGAAMGTLLGALVANAARG